VIVGAGGQLGVTLSALAAARGRDAGSFTSTQWDITDPGAAERIIEAGDMVVNCAAYTDVDGAESDEAAAYAVNATGPAHLARACARVGARLVHVSTDYVFCGSYQGDLGDRSGPQPHPYEPSAPTDPRGVYALSKFAGEQAVLAALPDAVVVRTAWLYTGGTGKDFVAVMRRLAAGEGPVDVVADQVGSPTYVGDLAVALLQIVDDRVPGPVLHAANEGAVSRCEQAQAVFEECGADPARVRPVRTGQFPRPAPRPIYSALGARESAAAGLTPLRAWRDALIAAMAAADGSGAADRPIRSKSD